VIPTDGLKAGTNFYVYDKPERERHGRDGLPDKLEIDHGLDPRDPADGLLDADGDVC
jgi:tRNA splicing endonuclease